MSEGILNQFIDEACRTMDKGNRNIAEPGRRAAQRSLRDPESRKRQAQSLAGTALTRWAQMTLSKSGLKAEALTLEKAPTAQLAGEIARQLQANADQCLENVNPGWAPMARDAINAAALTGSLLDTALETAGTDDAGETMGQLAQQCANLLKLSCQAADRDNWPTAWCHGEEARHAIEAAIDGTGPEGIPGSRGRTRRNS